MKGFFRKLFSPTTFIIIILVLELAAIGLSYFFIEFVLEDMFPENSIWTSLIYLGLRILIWVVEILVFFRIINKYENPEYKVTWLAFMAILPMTTVIMYLLFGHPSLRKKDRKIIEPTNKIQEELFAINEEEIDDFRSNVPLEYRGVFNIVLP